MLDCAAITEALGPLSTCAKTDRGWQVATQCLYPSFEQVFVYAIGYGDGFLVHDGGGAAKSCWMHGIDKRSISAALSSASKSYDCRVSGDHLRVEIVSLDWLWSAVASVANASASAANDTVGRLKPSGEDDIIKRAKAVLDRKPWAETKLDFPYVGSSGRTYRFDLSVKSGAELALIEAVGANPLSIASKYVALSDAEPSPGVYKWAIHSGDLSSEDKSLMSNVADLITIDSLQAADGKFLFS